MSAASKIVSTKSCIVDQSGKPTQPPKGKADDIGEVNRCMHPMGPPGQGTRQPRKDSQNNVEKIPMAAGASSNLQRLLKRGEEPKQRRANGIGTCAHRSEDRGVTSSQETGHVSLTEVTPTVRQRGTGYLAVPTTGAGSA